MPRIPQAQRHMLTHACMQESIKTTAAWFMAQAGSGHAAGLARSMARRAVSLSSDYDRTLHMIYLANDVLFKG